jgi:hypothetical protein
VLVRSGDETLLSMPYEFLPLPKEGELYEGLDRAGEYVADVKIRKVTQAEAYDKTIILTVAFAHEFAGDIRAIGRRVK